MKGSKIKPLGDRILVKPSKGQEKTAGGIFLPGSATEATLGGSPLHRGVVVAIGNVSVIGVSVDDVILFKDWGATEIGIGGETHLIIDSDDVVGIVNDDK